jgi:hypothetical protein
MIFFDQFENVFLQEGTTREFRDLALRIRNTQAKILIGFAWKTDMVSWIEGHPYRLRDEIRGAGDQLIIGPMGHSDIELFLDLLEKQLPSGLSSDLRQRVLEYSKGLPWLFKKLAGHVINEISEGSSQEQLASESLNVKSLFEADMAGLSPVEIGALKYIARFAPVSATEVTEKYDASVIQSLLDKRLAVAVGDKVDTYWDIFRDFLNTDGFSFGYTGDLSSSNVFVGSTLTGSNMIVETNSGTSLTYSAAQYLGQYNSIPMQYYSIFPGYLGSGNPEPNLIPLEEAPLAYRRFAAKAKTIASSESATLSIRGYDRAANSLVLDSGNWPLSIGTLRRIAEAALSLGINYRLPA